MDGINLICLPLYLMQSITKKVINPPKLVNQNVAFLQTEKHFSNCLSKIFVIKVYMGVSRFKYINCALSFKFR